jgi:predicted HicB family RNase H-like nuclease
MTAKRPRGRPPVEGGERRWLTLRVSDERLEAYAKAASKAGETMSAWVKRVLDRASRR